MGVYGSMFLGWVLDCGKGMQSQRVTLGVWGGLLLVRILAEIPLSNGIHGLVE